MDYHQPLNFRINKLLSILLAYFLIFLLGCGGSKENPPKPDPQPTNYTVKANIIGNTPDAVTMSWKDGNAFDSDITNAQGDAQLSRTGKEKTYTADSVTVEKSGFERYVKKNVTFTESGATVNYGSLVPENTLTHGDFSFAMVDKTTKDTIAKYALIDKANLNDTIRVDKKFTKQNIPINDLVEFITIKTDSSNFNFDRQEFAYEILNAENNVVEEVDAQRNYYETNLAVDVKTLVDGDRVDNLDLTMSNEDGWSQTFEVPENGLVSRTIALDTYQNDKVDLLVQATDSSHTLEQDVLKNVTLVHGNQNETVEVTTRPIDRTADYRAQFFDTFNVNLEGVEVTVGDKTGLTDGLGNVFLEDVASLGEDPKQWWKSVGDVQVTFSHPEYVSSSKLETMVNGENRYEEYLQAKAPETGTITYRVYDNDQGNEQVKNFKVTIDGVEQIINEVGTFTANEGSYNALFEQIRNSDFTFPNQNEQLNIIANQTTNVDVYVDATGRVYTATVNIDFDDENSNFNGQYATMANANANIDNVDHTLNHDGKITLNYELSRDENNPGYGASRNLESLLSATPTSRQFVEETFNSTINEGTNNFTYVVKSNNFDWQGFLETTVKEQGTNTTIAGANYTDGTLSETTDANGKATLGPYQLPEKSTAEFYLPGSITKQTTVSKDGFNESSQSRLVELGTTSYEDFLIPETIPTGTITFNVYDNDQGNEQVKNFEMTIDGVTQTINGSASFTGTQGDYSALFGDIRNSDFTFPDKSQNFSIVGDQTTTLDVFVDATGRVYTATVNIDFDDETATSQYKTMRNANANIDGVNHSLNHAGTLTLNYELGRDANNPGYGASQNLQAILSKTPTSRQFVEETFNSTINEGVNNLTYVVASDDFVWNAYLEVLAKEQGTNTAIAGADYTDGVSTVQTNSSGKATLGPYQLPEKSTTEFYLPGTTTKQTTLSKDGFNNSQKTRTLSIGTNQFQEYLTPETIPTGTINFNVYDNDQGNEQVKNFKVTIDGVEQIVSGEGSFTAQEGTYNALFEQIRNSDFTFPNQNEQLNIIADQTTNVNVFVDANGRVYTATVNIDFDDENSNFNGQYATMKNANANIEGTNHTLNHDGTLTLNYELSRDANNPGYGLSRNLESLLSATPTSRQFVEETFNSTINEGTNNFTYVVKSNNFDWQGFLETTVKEEGTNTTIAGADYTDGVSTVQTNSSGVATLGPYQLPEKSTTEFYLPGTTTKQTTVSKDGFNESTQNRTVELGTTSYEDFLSPQSIPTGTVTYRVYDNDQGNEQVKNFKVTIDGVEQIVSGEGSFTAQEGTYNALFEQIRNSDFTFPDQNEQLNIIADQTTNVDVFVDATGRVYTATVNIDFDDENSNFNGQYATMKNANANIEGTNHTLNHEGTLTVEYELARDASNPGYGASQSLQSILSKTPTSRQFVQEAFNSTIIEGTNNFTYVVKSNNFDWAANATYTVNNDASELVQGANVNSQGQNKTTNSNGEASFTPLVTLGEKSQAEFWLPEENKQVNYTITHDDHEEKSGTATVNAGNNNIGPITLTKIIQASTQHGDVAINPRLNGAPKTNTTITLTNTHVRDSTYTQSTTSNSQAIFWDIFVSDNNNPSTYEVKIVDNLADGTFLETITNISVSQDENGELNGSKIVNLTDIPDEVDVSVAVRNMDNLSQMESGTTVKMYVNGSYHSEQTTNGSGVVTFENIPGGSSVHTEISEPNYYTKTNNSINLVNPERESEMTRTLNVVSIPYQTYRNSSTHLEAEILEDHIVDAKINLPMLVGQAHIYFPSNPEREQFIAEAQRVMADLGLSDLIIENNSVNLPTQSQINSFNAFKVGRSPINFGTNVTSYEGTATTPYTSLQANGKAVTLSADPFNLGGSASDFTLFQHELFNLLGLKTNGSYPSVTNIGNNVNYFSSNENQAAAPIAITYNKVHYDAVDSQNNLIEYSYVNNIKE